MSLDIEPGFHEDDKINHYLSSLTELGDILINEDQTNDITRSILRLMLGTIMAPKGAIFLYSKKSEVFFPASLQGYNYSEPIPATNHFIQSLEFHAKGFIAVSYTHLTLPTIYSV